MITKKESSIKSREIYKKLKFYWENSPDEENQLVFIDSSRESDSYSWTPRKINEKKPINIQVPGKLPKVSSKLATVVLGRFSVCEAKAKNCLFSCRLNEDYQLTNLKRKLRPKRNKKPQKTIEEPLTKRVDATIEYQIEYLQISAELQGPNNSVDIKKPSGNENVRYSTDYFEKIIESLNRLSPQKAVKSMSLSDIQEKLEDNGKVESEESIKWDKISRNVESALDESEIDEELDEIMENYNKELQAMASGRTE